MHILFRISYLLILCSRILPVWIYGVLQGSGVTPLRCGYMT